ncbi:MAG: DUF342 domain-containing protein [Candidatus Hydrogenedentota bacterium]|nr:MAG: DUF342 domain-containing protein [Candidatus Hydrogenedentota bacterium]
MNDPERKTGSARNIIERITREIESVRSLVDSSAPEITSLESALEHAGEDSPIARDLTETFETLAAFPGGSAPSRDAVLAVTISEDRMSATARLLPPIGAGSFPKPEEMLSRLRENHGIRYGLDERAVRGLISLVASERKAAEAIVARGKQPLPGRGEHYEIVADLPAPPQIDEHGRIDYRAAASVPAVEPGDLLARRFPAEPGSAGRDVLGNIVPPPAKEEKPLLPGEGTEARPDGIHAAVAGEFVREGRILKVRPVRIVEGNVDYSTGNIEFPGSVIIRGSILDRFIVRCRGRCEVLGTIQAAFVEVEGDLSVAGGIVGREIGVVRCGGTIRCHFIENASVESRGDVIVEKAILHARIDTAGFVHLTGKPGTLIGGRIRAGRGVIAQAIGSITETATRIHFGEDYQVIRKRERIEEGILFLQERLQETLGLLRSLDPEENRAAVADLKSLQKQILEDIRALLIAKAASLEALAEFPDGCVAAFDRIHPGVTLVSKGVEKFVEEPMQNVVVRRRGDRFTFLPATDAVLPGKDDLETRKEEKKGDGHGD